MVCDVASHILSHLGHTAEFVAQLGRHVQQTVGTEIRLAAVAAEDAQSRVGKVGRLDQQQIIGERVGAQSGCEFCEARLRW